MPRYTMNLFFIFLMFYRTRTSFFCRLFTLKKKRRPPLQQRCHRNNHPESAVVWRSYGDPLRYWIQFYALEQIQNQIHFSIAILVFLVPSIQTRVANSVVTPQCLTCSFSFRCLENWRRCTDILFAWLVQGFCSVSWCSGFALVIRIGQFARG